MSYYFWHQHTIGLGPHFSTFIFSDSTIFPEIFDVCHSTEKQFYPCEKWLKSALIIFLISLKVGCDENKHRSGRQKLAQLIQSIARYLPYKFVLVALFDTGALTTIDRQRD